MKKMILIFLFIMSINSICFSKIVNVKGLETDLFFDVPDTYMILDENADINQIKQLRITKKDYLELFKGTGLKLCLAKPKYGITIFVHEILIPSDDLSFINNMHYGDKNITRHPAMINTYKNILFDNILKISQKKENPRSCSFENFNGIECFSYVTFYENDISIFSDHYFIPTGTKYVRIMGMVPSKITSSFFEFKFDMDHIKGSLFTPFLFKLEKLI